MLWRSKSAPFPFPFPFRIGSIRRDLHGEQISFSIFFPLWALEIEKRTCVCKRQEWTQLLVRKGIRWTYLLILSILVFFLFIFRTAVCLRREQEGRRPVSHNGDANKPHRRQNYLSSKNHLAAPSRALGKNAETPHRNNSLVRMEYKMRDFWVDSHFFPSQIGPWALHTKYQNGEKAEKQTSRSKNRLISFLSHEDIGIVTILVRDLFRWNSRSWNRRGKITFHPFFFVIEEAEGESPS